MKTLAVLSVLMVFLVEQVPSLPVDGDLQEVDIDWTNVKEEENNCNPWCTPPDWTAGQPEFYFSFEDSNRLALTNPDQIVDGLIGKAVQSSKAFPPESVDIPGLGSACITRLHTCTAEGGTFTAWVNVYQPCTANEGLLSSYARSPKSEGFRMYCGRSSGNLVFQHALYVGGREYKISTNRHAGWFHVAIVFRPPGGTDKPEINVYHNGTVADELRRTDYPKNNLVPASGDMGLGRSFEDDHSLHRGGVKVDEMILWNKALTAEQVNAIFQNDLERMKNENWNLGL